MKTRISSVVFFVTFLAFSSGFALDVRDLNLKLPFPAGEVWKTSCGYDGNIRGEYDPGCWAHASGAKDERGLDFNHYNSQGSPDDCGRTLVAVADGIVRDIRYSINASNQGYGWILDIYHGDNYLSRYAHLDERPELEMGSFVFRGQEVARCGKSGTVDCHLHFVFYRILDDGTLVSVEPEPMDGYQDLRIGGSTYQSTNALHSMCSIEQLDLDQFCRDNDPHPLVERFRNSQTGKIEVTYSPGDNKVWYYTTLCNIESYNAALSDIYDGKGGSYEQNSLDGSEDSDDGEPPPSTKGPNANVKGFRGSLAGKDDWDSHLVVPPGKSLDFELAGENEGDREAQDCEFKFYRTAKDSNSFDRDPNKYLGDDDGVDLPVDEKVTQHWRAAKAPLEPGRYKYYGHISCEDDTDSSNNTSREDDPTEYVIVDVVAQNVLFTSYVFSPSSPEAESAVSFTSYAKNPGPDMSKDLKINYYLSLGNSYNNPTFLGFGNIKAENFPSGATKSEPTGFVAPKEPGQYTFSAHLDGDNVLSEGDENDNWLHVTFTVQPRAAPPPPPMSFTITEPKAGTVLRTDRDKYVKWLPNNFLILGYVDVEYSKNNGQTWQPIGDLHTSNDGSRRWDKGRPHITKDYKNCVYVRVRSCEHPEIFAIAGPFTLDYKK